MGQAVLERKSATCLGEHLQDIGEKDYSEQTAREIDLGIRALLDEAYQRAKTLLESRRADLDTGGRLLLERETLTPEEFAPFLPIKRPAAALRLLWQPHCPKVGAIRAWQPCTKQVQTYTKRITMTSL